MSATFIGTNHGVYCSTFNGAPEPLGLADHEIYAIHAIGGALLAGTYGEGVFRSLDDGDTWTPSSDGLTATALRSFHDDPVKPGAVLCGCEPGRGFRSSDKGQTWVEMAGIGGVPGSDRWFLPYSPRAGALRNFWSPPGRPEHILAAIEVAGLLESQDRGSTWTQVDLYANAIQDDDIHWVSGHPQNPDVLLLALGWAVLRERSVDGDELGGVGISADGGKTWRKIMERDYTRAVLIPPTCPDQILAGPAKAVGRQGSVVVSNDRGETWEYAGSGLYKKGEAMADMVERFQVAPDKSIWAVCSGGRLYKAEAGEWNWTESVELPEGITAESVCWG
jgi:photosystem II stability/assembly factor-like uncharacterized protein